MESSMWWIWVVAGILLIALEIFTPGFILMWFGIAAIVTALPVYLGASTEIIVVTYAVTVLVLTILVRKITIGLMSKHYESQHTNVDSLVNSTAIVTEDVDSMTGTGKVRAGKEIWSATTEGHAIPRNTRVRILNVHGVNLVVERTETS